MGCTQSRSTKRRPSFEADTAVPVALSHHSKVVIAQPSEHGSVRKPALFCATRSFAGEPIEAPPTVGATTTLQGKQAAAAGSAAFTATGQADATSSPMSHSSRRQAVGCSARRRSPTNDSSPHGNHHSAARQSPGSRNGRSQGDESVISPRVGSSTFALSPAPTLPAPAAKASPMSWHNNGATPPGMHLSQRALNGGDGGTTTSGKRRRKRNLVSQADGRTRERSYSSETGPAWPPSPYSPRVPSPLRRYTPSAGEEPEDGGVCAATVVAPSLPMQRLRSSSAPPLPVPSNSSLGSSTHLESRSDHGRVGHRPPAASLGHAEAAGGAGGAATGASTLQSQSSLSSQPQSQPRPLPLPLASLSVATASALKQRHHQRAPGRPLGVGITRRRAGSRGSPSLTPSPTSSSRRAAGFSAMLRRSMSANAVTTFSSGRDQFPDPFADATGDVAVSPLASSSLYVWLWCGEFQFRVPFVPCGCCGGTYLPGHALPSLLRPCCCCCFVLFFPCSASLVVLLLLLSSSLFFSSSSFLPSPPSHLWPLSCAAVLSLQTSTPRSHSARDAAGAGTPPAFVQLGMQLRRAPIPGPATAPPAAHASVARSGGSAAGGVRASAVAARQPGTAGVFGHRVSGVCHQP